MFLIAHRGNNNDLRENSKEAILLALKQDYIDGVEFDVRMTKDKKIVIIHDSLINFISNGHGIVSKMTLRELKKYKFGNTKIATLNEVLKNIKTDKKILIEIKQNNNKTEIVDIIYKIIEKYQYLNIYLISFNYKIIKYIKDNYKSIKIGLIIGYKINENRLYNHFNINIVQYNYVNRINTKKETFIWTINDKKILEKIKIKNANIITDKPLLLSKIKSMFSNN